METTRVKKAKTKPTRLRDLVFSWSLKDVLNKDLYKEKEHKNLNNIMDRWIKICKIHHRKIPSKKWALISYNQFEVLQSCSSEEFLMCWCLNKINEDTNYTLSLTEVKTIPETFSSASHYLTSFIYPLIEETHADLLSSMTTVSQAPICEVLTVEISEGHKPPKNLLYDILVKGMRTAGNDAEIYEPENGDLIALTDVRPKCISDLNRPRRPYHIAVVVESPIEDSDELPKGDTHDLPRPVQILSSKPIEFGQERETNQKRETLFAVFLINMTTNDRIWAALNIGPELGNKNIIQKVLQPDSSAGDECVLCLSDSKSKSELIINGFNLNPSQEAAVLSCVATRECHHQNSVKLIWGPPGTGKTKTVATLLFELFRMKCRTLTCAPTNIAVLEVSTRLLRMIRESSKYGSYGLGDIVLFGNGKRMNIANRHDLHDVFLSFRVKILLKCFAPYSGWSHSLESMRYLLEEPEEMYHSYLKEQKKKNIWRKKTEGNKEKQKDKPLSNDNHPLKHEKKEMKCKLNQKNRGATTEKIALTFEEFVKMKFNSIGERLKFCITKLYIHLPTSFISSEVAKNMTEALSLLESLTMFFHSSGIAKKWFKEFHKESEGGQISGSRFSKFHRSRGKLLQILKCLKQTLQVPNMSQYDKVRNFCLLNASLLFCTASSSAKVPTVGHKPLELLVIDEAAQLKECESAIPLQISGIRHTILIGDEFQLPPMVKSKISEKAEFGRSLFQRLVLLGHRKHLLNLQYRMHPSISLFPNREFYDNLIVDASNVKETNYKRSYLHGSMYGSYSFINLAYGKEEFDHRCSTRNMVEVAVVSEIVASLSKDQSMNVLLAATIGTEEKVSVGVISPYKAQVYAIQENLGKKYTSNAHSKFSVSVRSVDGFQGGEEDVIIISTVRCNLKGSVGFLSNRQRANVALTRARYCLWVVGNGPTLTHSGTVWEKLVNDAKDRGCFYNAEEDNDLARAITISLIELGQLDFLRNKDSLLFRKARWKVCFCDSFWKSMVRIKNKEVCNKVFYLLEKLSSGWRRPQSQTNLSGTCSQILEQYKVTKLLYLVWSIDILKENSNYIQVLKVWDILPLKTIPKLEECLEVKFGNYKVKDTNRCKFMCLEGNLVVPMTWPVDANDVQKSILLPEGEDGQFSRSFASLSLQD